MFDHAHQNLVISIFLMKVFTVFLRMSGLSSFRHFVGEYLEGIHSIQKPHLIAGRVNGL